MLPLFVGRIENIGTVKVTDRLIVDVPLPDPAKTSLELSNSSHVIHKGAGNEIRACLFPQLINQRWILNPLRGARHQFCGVIRNTFIKAYEPKCITAVGLHRNRGLGPHSKHWQPHP